MKKLFTAVTVLFAAILFISGRAYADGQDNSSGEGIKLSGGPSATVYHDSASGVPAQEALPDYSSWTLAGQQWKYAQLSEEGVNKNFPYDINQPLLLLTTVQNEYYVENPDDQDSPYVFVVKIMGQSVYRIFYPSQTTQVFAGKEWRTVKSNGTVGLYLEVKRKYWVAGPITRTGLRLEVFTEEGKLVSVVIERPKAVKK